MTGSPSIRVGLRLPQYATGWPALRDAACRAEELGFDGLWVNDHLWTPGRRHADPAFDALTTLAALAPITSRARLGTMVLSASHRLPAVAAKALTLIDVISNGRLVVGLGTGSDRAEHEAYGIPFGTPVERTAGVRQTLEVIQAMAVGTDAAHVDGVLDAAPGRPGSRQRPHPPIWLAAHGPRLLDLAGRRADGVVAAFCEPRVLADRLAAATAVRPDDAIPLAVCAYLYVHPIPSEREALHWLAPEAEALGTTPNRLLRWLAAKGIVGSGAEIRERLVGYAAVGVTDVVLVLANRVPQDAVEALADAVLQPRGVAPATPTADAPSREANLVHLLLGRRRAEGLGAELAVIDDEGELSVDELSDLAERASGHLASVGVRAGERVVVAARDSRHWLAAVLGAAGRGAVAVPVDPKAPSDVLLGILNDCEPTALVVDDPEGAPQGRWTVIPARSLGEGPPLAPKAVHLADLAYIVYSSGSTGRPKGAMHAHGDLRAGIETYAAQVLKLGPGDRCLSAARLFTSLGFGNGFFRPLGRGAAIVLTSPSPTVRSILGAVERHAVTVLTGVPTFWAQLADFAARHPVGDALSTVRLAVSSGDSLPPNIAESVRTDLGLDLIEGLGCSECSNVVISSRPGVRATEGTGEAVPGIDLQLMDAEGRPVPEGEPGRLWIRSSSNTSGYWRRPDLTRETVIGEWIKTGDVLTCTAGTYRYVGRADAVFKVDGMWVSPGEIEHALLSHPAVSEAAVVGRPDDRGLTHPAAFVTLTAPLADPETELRRHVAQLLDRRRAPTTVRVLSALPRLASGKLDRRALGT